MALNAALTRKYEEIFAAHHPSLRAMYRTFGLVDEQRFIAVRLGLRACTHSPS